MSLLDAMNETVTVHVETVTTDEDGNTVTRPSSEGIATRARIWPLAQSGTSARRAEKNDEGFFTEQVYGLRFPRSFPHVLGAQAQITWNGKRYAVFGDPIQYNGSARTRHIQYMLVRS